MQTEANLALARARLGQAKAAEDDADRRGGSVSRSTGPSAS